MEQQQQQEDEEEEDGIDSLECFGVSDGSKSLTSSAPFVRLAQIDAQLQSMGFIPPLGTAVSSSSSYSDSSASSLGRLTGTPRLATSGQTTHDIDPLEALRHEAYVVVDVEDDKACGTAELEV